VMAAPDAELAGGRGEQLEHRAQTIVVLEREHGGLDRGGGFACLHPRRAVGPRAEGRVGAEQPKGEQLPDPLEGWPPSAEALANPPLLDRRERDLGGSRRSLNPQARCGSAWTKLDDGRHGEHSRLKERWRGA